MIKARLFTMKPYSPIHHQTQKQHRGISETNNIVNHRQLPPTDMNQSHLPTPLIKTHIPLISI